MDLLHQTLQVNGASDGNHWWSTIHANISNQRELEMPLHTILPAVFGTASPSYWILSLVGTRLNEMWSGQQFHICVQGTPPWTNHIYWIGAKGQLTLTVEREFDIAGLSAVEGCLLLSAKIKWMPICVRLLQTDNMEITLKVSLQHGFSDGAYPITRFREGHWYDSLRHNRSCLPDGLRLHNGTETFKHVLGTSAFTAFEFCH